MKIIEESLKALKEHFEYSIKRADILINEILEFINPYQEYFYKEFDLRLYLDFISKDLTLYSEKYDVRIIICDFNTLYTIVNEKDYEKFINVFAKTEIYLFLREFKK